MWWWYFSDESLAVALLESPPSRKVKAGGGWGGPYSQQENQGETCITVPECILISGCNGPFMFGPNPRAPSILRWRSKLWVHFDLHKPNAGNKSTKNYDAWITICPRLLCFVPSHTQLPVAGVAVVLQVTWVQEPDPSLPRFPMELGVGPAYGLFDCLVLIKCVIIRLCRASAQAPWRSTARIFYVPCWGLRTLGPAQPRWENRAMLCWPIDQFNGLGTAFSMPNFLL